MTNDIVRVGPPVIRIVFPRMSNHRLRTLSGQSIQFDLEEYPIQVDLARANAREIKEACIAPVLELSDRPDELDADEWSSLVTEVLTAGRMMVSRPREENVTLIMQKPEYGNYPVRQTRGDIDEVFSRAVEWGNHDQTPYFGETYADGVRATLEWVLDMGFGAPGMDELMPEYGE